MSDERVDAWRENRAPGWQRDIGYAMQDVLRSHRYEYTRKGSKPAEPGWHECSCGWEGYWCDFHPHVTDHLRVKAADLEAELVEVRRRAETAETDGFNNGVEHAEAAFRSQLDVAIEELAEVEAERDRLLSDLEGKLNAALALWRKTAARRDSLQAAVDRVSAVCDKLRLAVVVRGETKDNDEGND